MKYKVQKIETSGTMRYAVQNSNGVHSLHVTRTAATEMAISLNRKLKARKEQE